MVDPIDYCQMIRSIAALLPGASFSASRPGSVGAPPLLQARVHGLLMQMHELVGVGVAQADAHGRAESNRGSKAKSRGVAAAMDHHDVDQGGRNDVCSAALASLRPSLWLREAQCEAVRSSFNRLIEAAAAKEDPRTSIDDRIGIDE
jgi:hypothetical protein